MLTKNPSFSFSFSFPFSLILPCSHEVGPEASEGGESRPGEPDAAALCHTGEPRGAAPRLHTQLWAAQKSMAPVFWPRSVSKASACTKRVSGKGRKISPVVAVCKMNVAASKQEHGETEWVLSNKMRVTNDQIVARVKLSEWLKIFLSRHYG